MEYFQTNKISESNVAELSSDSNKLFSNPLIKSILQYYVFIINPQNKEDCQLKEFN